MDPFSAFLIIQAITQVAAAGYGMYQQRQAAEYQEDIADYNAKVAEGQAEQERLNREATERAERKASRRQLARIKAGYAKSGVLLEGTPAEALIEQVESDEMKIQQANLESAQKQKGLMTEAYLTRLQGKNTASAMKTQGAVNFGVSTGQALLSYAGSQATVNPDVRNKFNEKFSWLGTSKKSASGPSLTVNKPFKPIFSQG